MPPHLAFTWVLRIQTQVLMSYTSYWLMFLTPKLSFCKCFTCLKKKIFRFKNCLLCIFFLSKRMETRFLPNCIVYLKTKCMCKQGWLYCIHVVVIFASWPKIIYCKSSGRGGVGTACLLCVEMGLLSLFYVWYWFCLLSVFRKSNFNCGRVSILFIFCTFFF